MSASTGCAVQMAATAGSGAHHFVNASCFQQVIKPEIGEASRHGDTVSGIT